MYTGTFIENDFMNQHAHINGLRGAFLQNMGSFFLTISCLPSVMFTLGIAPGKKINGKIIILGS